MGIESIDAVYIPPDVKPPPGEKKVPGVAESPKVKREKKDTPKDRKKGQRQKRRVDIRI